MIAFDLSDLYALINSFLWPLFRIAGLFAIAPIFGESYIPNRIKIGMAIICTIVVVPMVAQPANIAPASFTGLLITGQQFLIGLALGLTVRLVFTATMMAGEFVGLQMGLAFASFFDPATGANTAVLSRILNMVALLLFISVDGHLLMLDGLVRTFDILPIGSSLMPNGWGQFLEWSGQLWISGMLLALPLIIILLTINLAMGILNRTAQQLSIFAVGFPITLTVGLITLSVVIPQSSGFLIASFQQGYEAMARVANGFLN